jgi:hypothetical protein
VQHYQSTDQYNPGKEAKAMISETGPHLDLVVNMIDQLIDVTLNFLADHTYDPDQLVLNCTREQALRGVQSLLHAECASASCDREMAWTLVYIITAAVAAYVFEELSDSASYILCRGWTILRSLLNQVTHSRLHSVVYETGICGRWRWISARV